MGFKKYYFILLCYYCENFGKENSINLEKKEFFVKFLKAYLGQFNATILLVK